ncbi:serine hydrolase domain-containing protein [Chondromyces crocatus]|uniref:Serine hydrolase n=1 Tax=Chondromyces crocatus TaxID=52 RepID=A0A0K1ESK5_CHOCO|nr:serine hydrolase domain-containing protein [Chondromyces crocatus]AKT43784.1 serine hydrolase [Chondromyces crocatus]
MQRAPHRRLSLALVVPALVIGCAAAPPPEPPAPTAPSGPAPAPSTATAPESAPVTTRVEKDDVHVTSAGTSIPRLGGWFFTQAAQHVALEDPEREVLLAVVESRGQSAAEAIPKAWDTVKPGAARKVEQTLTPPADSGLDEIVIVNYERGTGEGRLSQALARRKGDVVVVTLIDGALASVSRRSAQLRVVFGGIKLPGQEEESYKDTPASAFDAERQQRFDAFIASALEKTRVPGAAVAVVQGGKVMFEKGYGVRELGKKQAVTPSTLMMIGSTTKSMTTLLMASLVDEKRFTWDTPVTEVMPTFALGTPEATRQVTMKHLVCACAGMPRKDMELLFEFGSATPESLMEGLRSLKPTTGFGETFQYSNQMVAAAGFVAGRAFDAKRPLGAAYDAAMQARVFGPLGMKSTTVDFDRGLKAPDHASPHGLDLSKAPKVISPAVERFVVPLRPSGGAWSNTRDLSRYLLTELGRGRTPEGKQVVSEANLTRRWEPQIATSSKGAYGLGWAVATHKGVRIVEHGGGTMGFNVQLAFYPDKDLGLVILTNTQGGGAFIEAVQSRLFELAFGAKEEAQEQLAFNLKARAEGVEKALARVDAPADTGWIAPWVGTWRDPDLGTLELELTKSGPRLDAGEWAGLASRERAPDGATLLILTDPPLAGLKLILREKEGKRTLVLENPQHDYVFEQAPKP